MRLHHPHAPLIESVFVKSFSYYSSHDIPSASSLTPCPMRSAEKFDDTTRQICIKSFASERRHLKLIHVHVQVQLPTVRVCVDSLSHGELGYHSPRGSNSLRRNMSGIKD